MKSEQVVYKLKQIDSFFQQLGDLQNSQKMHQLIEKLEKQTFVVAFCGHFSAGKSSMINGLMGTAVLPASPIPTSANVVSIENGPSKARVWRKGGSMIDIPLLELDQVRRFAVNGQEIETIQIQHPTDFLPEGVQVMDTPGIDSTDDAHKIATESALHLADLVLYVMDYNHVQSEVNFEFTKTLKDQGKAVWLVVNQIDKHNDFELPFTEYAQSVKESFSTWGIEPDGIFYTSLKEEDHPHNQFAFLLKALQTLFQHKTSLLQRSVVQAALYLIEEHVQFQSANKEPARNEYRQILAEAGEESEDWAQRVTQLQTLLENNYTVAARLQEEMEGELYPLIENAILTPFQTTELCGRYLESRQPGFRAGFFFAGSKTELERKRRLDELHSDFAGKVSANLDWHFKDLLVKVPERFGIHNEEYSTDVYGLKVEITPQMLEQWVKEGALVSKEYVYQFAKDISSEVKSLYRRKAAEYMAWAVKVTESDAAKTIRELERELGKVSRLARAAEQLRNIDEDQAEYRAKLMTLLQEELDDTERFIYLYHVTSIVNSGQSVANSVEEDQPAALQEPGSNGLAATEVLEHPLAEKLEPIAKGEIKASLLHSAAKLRHAVEHIRDIPGFHTTATHMLARAERLEQNLFTVALFGAFSAGKSSFANAMLGDYVLPVSPNPTTATINKILPPTENWPHGSVCVKIKSISGIILDVKGSLSIFGGEIAERGTDEFLSDALQTISNLDGEEIPANAKPHFSFLKAVEKGLAQIRHHLGTELRVDLETFREYVAKEEKACFVETIELYYDCQFTRQGIMLIDTPGADSINARHTKVAFDYIKNADAVLFVTYYNHAFSNPDREFLIQLGRVKDTFEMDKMFFLVNAADLAADDEELADVVAHVRKNLVACGISMPRIYSVSSQMALLARLAEKGKLSASADHVYRKLTNIREEAALPSPDEVMRRSGVGIFEKDFITFTIEELTEVAIQGANGEIARALSNLQELIETAQGDEECRNEKRAALQKAVQLVQQEIDMVETESETRSIEKEVDELIYYVKQRVFHRYLDAFNESFSSSVLRDDVRDIKQVLRNCLQDLIRFLSFDLVQEMRATAVRIEKNVNQSGGRIFDLLAKRVGLQLPGCKLEDFQKVSLPIPEFDEDLQGAREERFTTALGFYKNGKDFFERDGKAKMREEVEKLLYEPIAGYLAEGRQTLKNYYLHEFDKLVLQLKQNAKNESKEYTDGLFAALSMQVNMTAIKRSAEQLEKLI